MVAICVQKGQFHIHPVLGGGLIVETGPPERITLPPTDTVETARVTIQLHLNVYYTHNNNYNYIMHYK